MIEILKNIRNWLVTELSTQDIFIWEPSSVLDDTYITINTLPTSRFRQVEESQLIEIRVIGNASSNLEEVANIQESIRNKVFDNYRSYGLYNFEVFNNSQGYGEYKRPESVQFYLLKRING
jgi:hypothetical protein